MAYLVARAANAHGCVALRVDHGKRLVDLKHSLNEETAGSGIEFVTISRPVAYGEYAPYTIMDSEEDFVVAVHRMARRGDNSVSGSGAP